MKCPHCKDGNVTLFTSVEECEHCGGTGVQYGVIHRFGQPIFVNFCGPPSARKEVGGRLHDTGYAEAAEAIAKYLYSKSVTPIVLTQPITFD